MCARAGQEWLYFERREGCWTVYMPSNVVPTWPVHVVCAGAAGGAHTSRECASCVHSSTAAFAGRSMLAYIMSSYALSSVLYACTTLVADAVVAPVMALGR